MLTRPEPTSNGNCDSWDFIVGKNPQTHSVSNTVTDTLQANNINLFTAYQHFDCGVYGTTCGRSVEHLWSLSSDPISWILKVAIYRKRTFDPLILYKKGLNPVRHKLASANKQGV